MVMVLDRASATTLSRPDTCCTSFVNSATKESVLFDEGSGPQHLSWPNKGLMISEGCE